MALFIPQTKRFKDRYFDEADSLPQQLIDQAISYIYDNQKFPEHEGYWPVEVCEQVVEAFNSENPQRFMVSLQEQMFEGRLLRRFLFTPGPSCPECLL